MEPQDWKNFNSYVWLRRIIQEYMGDSIKVPEIVKVEHGDQLVGGLSAQMHRLILSWPDGADDRLPRSLVVKTVHSGFSSHLSSAMMGHAREALFYHKYGTAKDSQISNIPKVLYAKGSMMTGDVLILMEDLSPVASAGGHLFGNQCWGPPQLPKDANIDPMVALETIFLSAADMHAKYWRQESLLSESWMKMVSYLQGKNRSQWEFATDRIKMKWQKLLKAAEEKTTGVKWSDTVISEINTTMANTNWNNFQRRFDVSSPDTPFTLCHGDFHASNLLWVWKQKDIPFYLVDWSEISVYCPFTDLAQFMISHVTTELRREHELRIFTAYYNRLVERGVSPKTFPIEACWARYKAGGIEKWTSMLIIMASFNLPDAAIQWFHDQVHDFIEDHGGEKNACLVTPYCF